MNATEPAEKPTPTIYQALSNVMAQVGAVGKGGVNKSQGYSFRGVDAVVNAVGPALREHGVITIPIVEDAHYEQIETRSGALMRQCTLRTRWRFVGPAGDDLEAIVMSESMDSGDKATAKAHSVSYRIALLQVLCIPTDDPDPDETTYERASVPVGLTVDETQQIRNALAPASDEVRETFRREFGAVPSAIASSRFAEAMEWIKARTDQ